MKGKPSWLAKENQNEKPEKGREWKGEGVYNSSYSCCSDVFLAELVWHTLHFLSFAPSLWMLVHLLSSNQPNTFCIPKNLLFKSMKNIFISACRGYRNIQQLYLLRFGFELKLYFHPLLHILFLFSLYSFHTLLFV